MSKKLKASEISSVRLSMLYQQDMKCMICKKDCSSDPVLDHNHKTGCIRGVLHRSCNLALGKLEGIARINKMSLDELSGFLTGCIQYLNSDSTSGLIHPTYFTPDEKKARAKAKRKREKEKALVRL